MGTFRLDFVGVGPQRTGTSWLHQLLEKHPALCFPKVVDEPMFFDLYYEKGLTWYSAFFAHQKRGQLCGEVSPTYFDVEVVPARIRQVNPECRIIINLRNPINRALSLYHHHLSKGRVSGSFNEAVSQMPRIVSSGRYAVYIPRWLDMFRMDQLSFVLLDDVETNPAILLKRIYNFLDVAEIEMPNIGNERINPLTMPHFPWLAKVNAQLVTWLEARGFYKVIEIGKKLGFREFIYAGGKHDVPGLTNSDQLQLLETYETDIAFLEDILNRDLSAWRQFI